MRWIIVITFILLVGIAATFIFRMFAPQLHETTIFAGGREFRALVADEPAERVRGLSGMPSLADDRVILFIFPEDGSHGIWMKDMRFSIDILWLDGQGRIVHVEEDVSPDTYPTVFENSVPARYVIEMNAGVVERLHVSIEQTVQLDIAH